MYSCMYAKVQRRDVSQCIDSRRLSTPAQMKAALSCDSGERQQKELFYKYIVYDRSSLCDSADVYFNQI